jgi:hypothetical protein
MMKRPEQNRIEYTGVDMGELLDTIRKIQQDHTAICHVTVRRKSWVLVVLRDEED